MNGWALRAIEPAHERDVDQIIVKVANAFNVEWMAILAKARDDPRTVLARKIAMYLARKHSTASFPRLGVHFRRDHTTVMSACTRIAHEARRNPALAGVLFRIGEQIVDAPPGPPLLLHERVDTPGLATARGFLREQEEQRAFR